VWKENFMGRFQYAPSQGAAQYRRTLYAFWRRASAPTFLFDSTQRRMCEVRPRRTNTPLHALTLLNNVSQLEASRELARSAIGKSAESEERLELLFRHVVSRKPTVAEMKVLKRELARASAHYNATPSEALALLDFGQPENRWAEKPVELAAYLIVASMVLNLDEAITHE
jgi:hypothetical protein